MSTNKKEVGSKECINFLNGSQSVECCPCIEEFMEAISERLEVTNRVDFPLRLNPLKASFMDVALHGVIRQRKNINYVKQLIRYARFMETHVVQVDFRNPDF